MPRQTNAEAYSAAGLAGAPAFIPSAPWRVASVRAMPGYLLHVKFLDGTEGTVEMAELIKSPDAGVFAALADPIEFARAAVDLGAVTWPACGLDIAPDAMYDGILASGGVWRVEP